ncbi:MAG: peptidoglycan DD-metalloendopeptidase family protein [Candidatus Cloacimonetes bacterium]|nr:peptidoglycan DD-metalloendopeptidase family protein [Candidatus Cloacimonadota bacterium]
MKASGSFKIFLVILLFTAQLAAFSRRPLYVTPSDKYHIVQPGDTLYHISQQSGVSVEDLKLCNNLPSDNITVGQKIYYEPRDPVKRTSYITERPLPPDKKHVVQKGETLTIIANIYNLDLLDLLHYNTISNWELSEGQVINLAGGMLSQEPAEPVPQETVAKTGKKEKRKPEKKVTEKQAMVPIKTGDFISPLEQYRISQHYNKDERHQGIDLAAPAGTPVLAVMEGTVIYSGTQKGYGNLIILEHENRLMTVYAHNEKNLVPAGDKVKQGEQIATVGSTGRSTGNHLHFEIRQEGHAVDPEPYIINPGR